MRVFILVFCGLMACTNEPTQTDVEGQQVRHWTEGNIPVYDLELQVGSVTDSAGDPFLTTMPSGLATDGFRVLLWTKHDGAVVIDENLLATQVGAVGAGPGEYKNLVAGHLSPMGVHLIGRDYKVRSYQDHVFQDAFRIYASIPFAEPMFRVPAADHFVVTEQYVITPTPVNQISEIGAVYDHAGGFVQTIDDPEFDKGIFELSHFAHLTMWASTQDRLYALYAYLGTLLVIDRESLEILNRFELETPERAVYQEMIVDHHQDKPLHERTTPFFFDFQIFDGKGYASSSMKIHEIDLATGAVTALFRCVADQGLIQDFQGGPISMPYFAILENGSVLHAHPVLDQVFVSSLPKRQ